VLAGRKIVDCYLFLLYKQAIVNRIVNLGFIVIHHGQIMNLSDEFIEPIAIRRAKSLTTLVSEAIEKLIVSGELKPGDRVNEHRLAATLNVNRGVLREARSGLIRSGLLVSVPNRGVFVRTVTHQELYENSEMRELMTGFFCHRAAEKASPDEKVKLKQLVDTMSQAVAVQDGTQYDQANTDFHLLLMAIADQNRAGSIYEDLVRESHLARRMVLTEQKQLEASNSEHQAMVDAIIAGDPLKAREAGERHVRNGRIRWLKTVSQETNP
jgi:DNA-binding GntR family transcriptional regulator